MPASEFSAGLRQQPRCATTSGRGSVSRFARVGALEGSVDAAVAIAADSRRQDGVSRNAVLCRMESTVRESSGGPPAPDWRGRRSRGFRCRSEARGEADARPDGHWHRVGVAQQVLARPGGRDDAVLRHVRGLHIDAGAVAEALAARKVELAARRPVEVLPVDVALDRAQRLPLPVPRREQFQTLRCVEQAYVLRVVGLVDEIADAAALAVTKRDVELAVVKGGVGADAEVLEDRVDEAQRIDDGVQLDALDARLT